MDMKGSKQIDDTVPLLGEGSEWLRQLRIAADQIHRDKFCLPPEPLHQTPASVANLDGRHR